MDDQSLPVRACQIQLAQRLHILFIRRLNHGHGLVGIGLPFGQSANTGTAGLLYVGNQLQALLVMRALCPGPGNVLLQC